MIMLKSGGKSEKLAGDLARALQSGEPCSYRDFSLAKIQVLEEMKREGQQCFFRGNSWGNSDFENRHNHEKTGNTKHFSVVAASTNEILKNQLLMIFRLVSNDQK